MALLNKTEITILLATGGMGVGKSLLTTAYALQELEKGAISKIIYVPNNSFTENAREIGALPGTLEEKEELFLGTLYDMIGGYSVDRLLNQDQLEVAPISTMRGRNFTDSIVIVNEAQNLTDKHIKLLISRCGENCRIFFDGDIRQSDSYIFREKNGLVLLNKLKDSEDFGKLFGTVRLVQTERSKTAQAAGYLDTVK
jgi:phosphate starvation-inducible PhoH-like protein